MLDLSFDISFFGPKYMKKYTLQYATGTGNIFPIYLHDTNIIMSYNYVNVAVISFLYKVTVYLLSLMIQFFETCRMLSRQICKTTL